MHLGLHRAYDAASRQQVRAPRDLVAFLNARLRRTRQLPVPPVPVPGAAMRQAAAVKCLPAKDIGSDAADAEQHRSS